MPECCVAYTSDSKYLFPTLVSAMQARRNSSPEGADVIIFCLGLDRKAELVFTRICAQENIGLIPISAEMVEGQMATMARLFLNRFVPSRYSQFLYLDGDVHILASLDPLIYANVQGDHFLAANDPMTFQLSDNSKQSRDLSSHLKSIGLTHEQSLRYFNSGVLRMHRQGWDSIGQEAWEYFRHNPGLRFTDQDALNVVTIDKRMPMSLAWNFPVFMRNSRVESQINPKITHFMSSPKPWHGSFPPWTQKSCIPYANAIKTYPALAPFSFDMAIAKRAIYHVQQRSKKISETLAWGLSERRSRILIYESSCAL